MNRNQEMLEKGSYGKIVLNLCVPTIVIMLVMVVYNMADTFFIGQTGNHYLITAVSLCAPIFSILSGLGTLLGSGGCTAISLALGRKEPEQVKAYSSFCCYGALFIGALFLVVLLLCARPLALLLGADENTLTATLQYMRIMALGSPIVLFSHVFTNIIRADGAARESMIANGLGTISNIILDAIFILGFSWGVAGAAFATVLGNGISCLYLIYYIRKKQPMLTLSPRYFSMKWKVAGAVLPLGIPMACSTLLMSFSHIISNRMMMGYGSVALASQSVSGKLSMVITMLAMGICMGIQPALSYNYASGNRQRVKMMVKNTAIFTFILGSFLSVLCIIFRNPLIGAFIDNEEILAYGQIMVLASVLVGPFYGFYQLCQSFLQATGKASYATIVAVLDKGLFFLPLLFLLSKLFGLYGIVFTGATTLFFSLAAGLLFSLHWSRNMPSLQHSDTAGESCRKTS